MAWRGIGDGRGGRSRYGRECSRAPMSVRLWRIGGEDEAWRPRGVLLLSDDGRVRSKPVGEMDGVSSLLQHHRRMVCQKSGEVDDRLGLGLRGAGSDISWSPIRAVNEILQTCFITTVSTTRVHSSCLQSSKCASDHSIRCCLSVVVLSVFP